MPKLCLLCGMPFSGKTTLGKAVSQYIDSAYISLDEINEARGLSGGDGIPVEEWEKTHFLAMEQLQIITKLRKDIVLDDTNCFRWLRDRFRNLAAKSDYQTTVIFMDISNAEIWQRMSNNQKTQARHTVKPEIIKEMTKTFELPQEDENVVRYAGEQPINEWIIGNFRDIANQS